MATNTTTTTTTAPNGDVTVQKVESFWDEEELKVKNALSSFHTTLTTWITHVKGLAATGALASAAYAAYAFAKHLI